MCALVHQNTQTQNVDYVSLRGSFQFCWRTDDAADGEKEKENERERGERNKDREGRRGKLAVNSSSCLSGSAEQRHECPPESISGWQWRNHNLSCLVFILSMYLSFQPLLAIPSPSPKFSLGCHLMFLFDSFPYLFKETE